ncbi:unnamed protein product [Cladocopium goreaui]|uniref:Uncharacterized protein n=1 Tax=Cladocopium goreaui TaxID=2562237 RepID=A0A9P1FUQ9_9DINO|nr:unnamed protein product [Cladocopium goreaui]
MAPLQCGLCEQQRLFWCFKVTSVTLRVSFGLRTLPGDQCCTPVEVTGRRGSQRISQIRRRCLSCLSPFCHLSMSFHIFPSFHSFSLCVLSSGESIVG